MDELDVLADEVRKQEAAAATRIGAQEPDAGSEMPPLEGVTGMSPSFSSLDSAHGQRMPVLVLVLRPDPTLA